MKILVLNSGPRSDQESGTILMLGHLIEGMEQAGADVERIDLKTKTIKHCTGCFSCWTKTPGKCILKDDMTKEIFPKLLECDLVVYASPLYYHTVNARMAALIERTLPFSQPFFEQDKNGITYHPPRYKLPPNIILSVCGFPEDSEFDAMREFFTRTRSEKNQPIAFICRSSVGMISLPMFKEKAAQIFEATRKAGREVVESMKISSETIETITQPLLDALTFARMGNMYWHTCIAEGVTPKAFAKKDLKPRPRTIEDFMFLFPFGANAASAGENKKTVLFNFTADVKGVCGFTVENGLITAVDGAINNPDLTIDTPFELWIDIMMGKVDGSKMFMEQKYQVTGDMEWMMQLFSGK